VTTKVSPVQAVPDDPPGRVGKLQASVTRKIAPNPIKIRRCDFVISMVATSL